MKNLLFLIFLFCSTSFINAQQREIFRVPDLPGYQTLICDFHIHTVFSDGLVWPTVRVDEAWREGLDAIAITDHLEYLPHSADIRTDFNRSWQIASKYAIKKDVIVIPGTEITKGMPPGHFNALFIKDAKSILNDDYILALEEAAGQGAFIMWNHPGWLGQTDTIKWWDEHTDLYNKGWMHGIEVANEFEYYPTAVDWAIEKSLTILGNSDFHGPFLTRHLSEENHRTCTFVFSIERSLGGIREALFNGRTIAYIGDNLIGTDPLLKAFFQESVEFRLIDKSEAKYSIKNKSDLYYEIILYDRIYEEWHKKIELKPGFEVYLDINEEINTEDLELEVVNLITGDIEVLTLLFSDLTFVN